MCFLTPNKKNSKRKALAFNWDRCCHLVLCLRLILIHCCIIYLFKLIFSFSLIHHLSISPPFQLVLILFYLCLFSPFVFPFVSCLSGIIDLVLSHFYPSHVPLLFIFLCLSLSLSFSLFPIFILSSFFVSLLICVLVLLEQHVFSLHIQYTLRYW